MARVHLYQYGPSVGRPTVVSRITTGVIRDNLRSGTSRIRVSPGTRLGLGTTSKSELRRKIVKGIRQPGYQAPNYPSPLY